MVDVWYFSLLDASHLFLRFRLKTTQKSSLIPQGWILALLVSESTLYMLYRRESQIFYHFRGEGRRLKLYLHTSHLFQWFRLNAILKSSPTPREWIRAPLVLRSTLQRVEVVVQQVVGKERAAVNVCGPRPPPNSNTVNNLATDGRRCIAGIPRDLQTAGETGGPLAPSTCGHFSRLAAIQQPDSEMLVERCYRRLR